MQRYQISKILADLKKKMVLLTGPRQVGKTWIAKEVKTYYKNPLYLNHDNIEDAQIIREMKWSQDVDLLIFDELHKKKDWKNYLKGVYDTKPEHMHILVTGSARLSAYNQVGDSLVGRYRRHHIYPLSLRELSEVESKYDPKGSLKRLLERGGFPEPFLADNKDEASLWRREYRNSMIKIDVLNFATIEDLHAMESILKILERSVGSPISYSSIARNLAISPVTVKRYIRVLEDLFLIFMVRPYTKKVSRAILKEPKVYFFDTGLVEGDDGVRFENALALEFFKDASRRTNETGSLWTLHYLRTKEDKETDFVIAKDDNAQVLIEAKLSDTKPAKNLIFFLNRYNLPAVQFVAQMRQKSLATSGVRILNAETEIPTFLETLL